MLLEAVDICKWDSILGREQIFKPGSGGWRGGVRSEVSKPNRRQLHTVPRERERGTDLPVSGYPSGIWEDFLEEAVPQLCQPKQGNGRGRGLALEGTRREGADKPKLGSAPTDAPSHQSTLAALAVPGSTSLSQLTLPGSSEVEILLPFTRRGWSPERADHFPKATAKSCLSPWAHLNHPGSNRMTFRNALMLSSWIQEGFSSCFTCNLASKHHS